MSDNDSMPAQEMHELGVSGAVDELKTMGHEILAVNPDITQMPQVVTRKGGTLRFIYVGTAAYPGSVDPARLDLSKLIDHAERNGALPFFARVQLARADASDDVEKGQLRRGDSVVFTFQGMRMIVRTDRVYYRDRGGLRTIASRQLEELAHTDVRRRTSENPFVALVRRAHESRWCTKPYCTTCYATDYRKALKELAENLGDDLAVALAGLEPNELTALPNWRGATRILLLLWPLGIRLNSILESWIPKILPENVAFADFVLYRVIRCYSWGHPVRQRWIEECTRLAFITKDQSLVESLVLTLGRSLFEHHELLQLAMDMAPSSKRVERALKDKCFVRFGPA